LLNQINPALVALKDLFQTPNF